MTPDNPWLRLAAIIGAVFVVHEAVLRGLRLDGVRPDIMIGLAVVAGLTIGPEVGAVAGFAGGLLTDLFVNTPFGLTALVACVIGFVVGSIQQILGPGPRWSVPVMTAIASAVAEVTWAALGTVLGVPGLLRPHLLVVVAVVATVNGALAPALVPLVRWTFARAPAGTAA